MNWVKGLFKKLEVIYPLKWTDQFPTAKALSDSYEEWSLGLEGVTGEQIAHGLQVCRKTIAWPPAISQFRDACLSRDSSLYNTAAYKPFVALPKPPRDKAVGVAALAAMRGAL